MLTLLFTTCSLLLTAPIFNAEKSMFVVLDIAYNIACELYLEIVHTLHFAPFRKSGHCCLCKCDPNKKRLKLKIHIFCLS